jgi:hypothetical protein
MFTWVQNENGYNMKSFWVMESYGFMLNLFFGLMGMFLSILIKRGKSFVGAGVGIVLGFIHFRGHFPIDEVVRWLGYISPFNFVDFKVYERITVLPGGWSYSYWYHPPHLLTPPLWCTAEKIFMPEARQNGKLFCKTECNSLCYSYSPSFKRGKG